MLLYLDNLLGRESSMATYLILNVIVLASVVVALKAWGALRLDKAMFVTLGILMITTAIFDSLIIHFDLCDYNPDHILGIYIIKAPVEDFFYSLIAGLLIPNLWHKVGAIRGKN